MRTIFLGSGGGGGSAYRHSSGAGYGGYGGTGGGAVMLFANKLKMSPTSYIDVRGSDATGGNTNGGAGGNRRKKKGRRKSDVVIHEMRVSILARMYNCSALQVRTCQRI